MESVCRLITFTKCCSRFDAYRKASEQFTISQADIVNTNTAAAQIDRVLADLITHVSLFMPLVIYPPK